MRERIASEWVELNAGGGLAVGLHLANPPSTPVAGSKGAITIELKATETLESVVEALKARGVPFKGEILNYEHVWLATLTDPDDTELLVAQTFYREDVGTAAPCKGCPPSAHRSQRGFPLTHESYIGVGLKRSALLFA